MKGFVLTPLKAPRMFATFNVMEKAAWLPLNHIDCGFAAKRSLEHLVESKKVSPLVGANFLSTCLKLSSTMAHKILERSPLKYSFVWNLQALDPSFAIRNKKAAAECMKSVSHKWVDVRSVG